MKKFAFGICILFCLYPISSSADTLLLLHGYLSSSSEWQRSGIIDQLDKSGWRDGGTLAINGEGSVIPSKDQFSFTRRVYSLEFASEQSIDFQTEQRAQYIQYVRHHHEDEQIILIGHSAGGVVARTYMVKEPNTDLIALVTIASPHLGTKNAEYAQSISENILIWVYGLPGLEKLYRSQGLFFDLIPDRSDNLIGWLNYQEHPPARYYSIVREESNDAVQDFIVPARSQDMNEVYALRGRCKTYKLKGVHSMSSKDAQIINSILLDLYTI